MYKLWEAVLGEQRNFRRSLRGVIAEQILKEISGNLSFKVF